MPTMMRAAPSAGTLVGASGLGGFYREGEPVDAARRSIEFTQRAIGSGHCCSLCGPFMTIPPLLKTDRGTWINPTFDMMRVFHLSSSPFPAASALAAGQQTQAAFTVPAEENEMGDLLVSELMAATPSQLHNRTAVLIKSQQNDRVFMNAPVLDRFVFSNAQMRRPLPCCFLIQSTNFAQMQIKNISTTATTIKIVARGQRFLPYQQPELRQQILSYWNANRTTPYWLTIDLVQQGTGIVALDGGGVQIPAGQTATCFMTVPGAGDFETEDPMCLVEESTGLFTVTPSDVDILISEGVGRQLMDGPVPIGDFVAQPNRTATPVAAGQSGFQGEEYRASSGGHGNGPRQFLKRNTRVRVVLTNNAGSTANVWFTWRGCMHYYETCPPDVGLHRALSLEPLVGPMLTSPTRCPPYQTFSPVPGQGMQPFQPGPVRYPMPTPYQLPGGRGAPLPYGYPAGAAPYLPQAAAASPGMQGWKVEPADGGYGGRW